MIRFFITYLLTASSLVAASPIVTSPQPTCSIQYNTERLGGDYQTSKVASLSACLQKCRSSSSCAAAQFNKKTKYCTLKKSIGPAKRNVKVDGVICRPKPATSTTATPPKPVTPTPTNNQPVTITPTLITNQPVTVTPTLITDQPVIVTPTLVTDEPVTITPTLVTDVPVPTTTACIVPTTIDNANCVTGRVFIGGVTYSVLCDTFVQGGALSGDIFFESNLAVNSCINRFALSYLSGGTVGAGAVTASGSATICNTFPASDSGIITITRLGSVTFIPVGLGCINP